MSKIVFLLVILKEYSPRQESREVAAKLLASLYICVGLDLHLDVFCGVPPEVEELPKGSGSTTGFAETEDAFTGLQGKVV